MRKGAVITAIVVLLAISGVMAAFVSNASPYVTIQEARQQAGDQVHVSGDLLKETLKADAFQNLVTFDIKDVKGDRISVRYDGPPPANMGEATQVVVIGTVEGSTLKATRLLLKCPSKYEAEQE